MSDTSDKSGVSRIIAVLEEEIESYDLAADSFPFNDEAYVGLENELDRLEIILEFVKLIKPMSAVKRQGWAEKFKKMNQNGDDILL